MEGGLQTEREVSTYELAEFQTWCGWQSTLSSSEISRPAAGAGFLTLIRPHTDRQTRREPDPWLAHLGPHVNCASCPLLIK